MKITLPLIFSILINFSEQIFLVLDPQQKRCIFKNIVDKKPLSGMYYFSGQEEDKNVVTITHPSKGIIFKKEKEKNGSFNYSTDVDGSYTICFESLSKSYTTVSFDFTDERKEEQLISVRNTN
jgi:hypothetical protein